MLKIKLHRQSIEYERKIESMGEGLALLRITAKSKRVGQNHHLLYKNDRKPPFDVALNPEHNTIEYISFFLQDEKIKIGEIRSDILFRESNIEIFCVEFNSEKNKIFIQKEFDVFKHNDTILVLEKGIEDKVMAYRLNDLNYILLDERKEIVGLVMTNIEEGELRALKKSQVI